MHILYALFPLNYARYIEPFGGSCAVLLGKPKPDKFEVYNDYNRNLVNLFQCMKDRPHAFIKELENFGLNARVDFESTKAFFKNEEFTDKYVSEECRLIDRMYPEIEAEKIRELYCKPLEDHDLRRAVLYLKLIRLSYSSGCKSFACQPFNLYSLSKLIKQLSRRMANTIIENQDFEVLIKHYDRHDAFIYCDPPYFTSEYVYECGFNWDDHVRLRDTLANAKGKWLVSYNDCPKIRELYSDFNFFNFKRIHSMVQRYQAGKEFPELLIGNYDLYEREREQPRQLSFDEDYKEDINKILKENIICKLKK